MSSISANTNVSIGFVWKVVGSIFGGFVALFLTVTGWLTSEARGLQRAFGEDISRVTDRLDRVTERVEDTERTQAVTQNQLMTAVDRLDKTSAGVEVWSDRLFGLSERVGRLEARFESENGEITRRLEALERE